MTWNEVMEPPGHQRSMTSYNPKKIFRFFTHINHSWALKNIKTYSNRRVEHAERWNCALAPSEAKLSTITGFRHFSALDLTSEVKGWPGALSLDTNRFVSRRALINPPPPPSFIQNSTVPWAPLDSSPRFIILNAAVRQSITNVSALIIKPCMVTCKPRWMCSQWHRCLRECFLRWKTGHSDHALAAQPTWVRGLGSVKSPKVTA